MKVSKIDEALGFVTPEDQTILRGLIQRLDVPETEDVNVIIERLAKGAEVSHDEQLAVCSLLGANRHKFAPKMTHDQRCQVLALHHAGINREILSKLYGVDRRTITHIYTANSPHYKAVRDERIGIGAEVFYKKYVTPDVFNKAMQFTGQHNGVKPSKLADKKKGLHIVRNEMCTYDHRVVIQWVDDGVNEAGWYYQDLDSDFPDKWFTAGEPESINSSQSCYNAMLKDIVDKINV